MRFGEANAEKDAGRNVNEETEWILENAWRYRKDMDAM